jgi:repressor LexA
MEPKSLPSRQKDVLLAIARLSSENGYPPTLAELAGALGLKNRMTVHQHVAALKKKGLVHWEPGLNRSLRILPEGLDCIGVAVELEGEAELAQEAAGVSSLSGKTALRDGSSKTRAVEAPKRGIPLVGAIAAGSPIDAIEHNDFLEVEGRYAPSGCFALKVKGESMIEDGIYDGDFVIVKPNPSPENGEIVVALVDESATLKRFFKERGGYRLQPANSAMQPIFIAADDDQPLIIQGTVVALFRNL